MQIVSRREFLKGLGFAAAAVGLNACVPRTPNPADSQPSPPTPASSPATRPAIFPTARVFETLLPKDLEDFATTTLHHIFTNTYGPKDKQPKNWGDPSAASFTGNILPNLNRQIGLNVLADSQQNTPVKRAIKAKMADIWQQEFLARGPTMPQESTWWLFIEATRRIYRENGFAVEPNTLTMPPTIAVYRPIKPETKNTATALNVFVGGFDIYRTKKSDIIFDSYDLTNLRRPAAEGYLQYQAVFIHEDNDAVASNVEVMRKTALGDEDLDELALPPPNDKEAKKLREAAGEMVRPMLNRLTSIYLDSLTDHESAHLIRPFPNNIVSNEARSYVAQLYSKNPDVVKISAATYLFVITQKGVMEKQRLSDNQTFAGIQLTLAEVLDAITTASDQEVKEKLEIGNFKGEKKRSSSETNRFLPTSEYSDEYTFYVLSRIGNLSANNLNDIALSIMYKYRHFWLPPGVLYNFDAVPANYKAQIKREEWNLSNIIFDRQSTQNYPPHVSRDDFELAEMLAHNEFHQSRAAMLKKTLWDLLGIFAQSANAVWI